MEFTAHDFGGVEDIELILFLAGTNAKGERLKLYMAKLHGRPQGGTVRLEDAEGKGFDVGRVHMSVNSFSKPSLVISTFNGCKQLTGRVLSLAADTDECWKLKYQYENIGWAITFLARNAMAA